MQDGDQGKQYPSDAVSCTAMSCAAGIADTVSVRLAMPCNGVNFGAMADRQLPCDTVNFCANGHFYGIQ
ncbi:hypothetical protein DM806_12535 [Sphingobium lactosutens]|uniref:hypothetical protein n=1 Tax=Sphingobium lactosutens TaxID=522773 RepID=UPI0015BB1522|nr:hypothetical protein [Sphingobium lactosutens]NWK96473.1 hypothetical protein [Sphingobium lactosutens]